ncbi:MAG: hypothetical protein J0H50_14855 [Xanthomonadales bacterium]|nr:hypothetical protein [Xanthomonadales bacterium]
MDIVVDTSQVAQLAELWQRAPDITRQEMLRTITECDLLTQGELMQSLPRGAGGVHGVGLAGTIFREEQPLADNVLGLVATKEPYAEYLEMGTRPHRVGPKAIDALVDWVEARIGLHEDEAEDMAQGIAWKIRKRGTKANPVWQQTYQRLQGEYLVKFQAAVQRITARLVGGAA